MLIVRPAPLIVIVYVPAAVPLATLMLTVPALPTAWLFKVTVAEMPVELVATLALKLTPVSVNPANDVLVIAIFVLAPASSETDPGVAVSVKPGVPAGGESTAIRLAPFGLPQPVARSKPAAAV